MSLELKFHIWRVLKGKPFHIEGRCVVSEIEYDFRHLVGMYEG